VEGLTRRRNLILLLDAHALIWALEDSPRLSATARSMAQDTANTVLASVVSVWEILVAQAMADGAPLVSRDHPLSGADHVVESAPDPIANGGIGMRRLRR
jgi:PIN domain nuclease of toxin-antitoxin system